MTSIALSALVQETYGKKPLILVPSVGICFDWCFLQLSTEHHGRTSKAVGRALEVTCVRVVLSVNCQTGTWRWETLEQRPRQHSGIQSRTVRIYLVRSKGQWKRPKGPGEKW
jgi:hypothetical protein